MSWQTRYGFSASRSRRNLKLESLERRALLAVDLVSVSPADGATGVDVGANIVLTFSEAVQPGPGSGNILIKNAADDSLIEGINVHSAQVVFDGATVTINPSADLPADTNIYVEIDPSAIRDMTGGVANAVIFSEDFERLKMIDSNLAGDGEFNPLADANQYALTFTGTLVVNEAGEYTFGGNSDDGMWLLIDLNRDGDLSDISDEVIVDQTTHGNTDRLSTCGIESNVASCVGAGTESYNLAAGEYLFQYGYFEQGGGSSGEFFYAKGTLEEFNPAAFVLVGNDSQGIGVGEGGITATTYKAIDGDTVTYFYARDMVDGFIDPAEGFPASEVVPTADAWNTGGSGRFLDNHPVPGVPQSGADTQTDWSPEHPFGWTNTLADPTPAGGRPEYNGWVPLDKNFWINQQGNQDRANWTLGTGTVAVADPDAFDDFVDIDAMGGLFNALYTTPAIDLTGVSANSVKLEFDSSFRSEPTQIAILEVSFDDGASWAELLQYVGNAAEDQDHINEHLSFDLSNPSGGTMRVRWSLVMSSNDWWWAIDNISITANVAGATSPAVKDRETYNFDTFAAPGIPGDLNGDNKVDLQDFNILKSNFGKDPATPEEGDIDGNGSVGLSDFNILKSNFGQGASATDEVLAIVGLSTALDDDADDGLGFDL